MREKITLSLIIDLTRKYGNQQVIAGVIGSGRQTRETSSIENIIKIGRVEAVKNKNRNSTRSFVFHSTKNHELNNQIFSFRADRLQ